MPVTGEIRLNAAGAIVSITMVCVAFGNIWLLMLSFAFATLITAVPFRSDWAIVV